MTAPHFSQHGTYLITTNTKNWQPWLTLPGVPERVMSDLLEAKFLFRAKVYAFCVLPDHLHLLLWPGESGITKFIHSFKRNTSRNSHRMLARADCVIGATDMGSRISGYTTNPNTAIRTPGYTTNPNTAIRTPGYTTNPNTAIRTPGYTTGGVPFTGWQHGFHDRRITNDRALENALTYVHYSAFRHGLVGDPLHWPWSSLKYSEILDARI